MIDFAEHWEKLPPGEGEAEGRKGGFPSVFLGGGSREASKTFKHLLWREGRWENITIYSLNLTPLHACKQPSLTQNSAATTKEPPHLSVSGQQARTGQAQIKGILQKHLPLHGKGGGCLSTLPGGGSDQACHASSSNFGELQQQGTTLFLKHTEKCLCLLFVGECLKSLLSRERLAHLPHTPPVAE